MILENIFCFNGSPYNKWYCGAGHGDDDDYQPATSEQIIQRLDDGYYWGDRTLMISTLLRNGIIYNDTEEVRQKASRIRAAKEEEFLRQFSRTDTQDIAPTNDVSMYKDGILWGYADPSTVITAAVTGQIYYQFGWR